MRAFLPIALASMLTTLPLWGAELVIEPRPFSVQHVFTGTVVPAESIVFEGPARRSGEWVLEMIVPHGSRVSQGDVLVRFDKAALEDAMADLKSDLASAELALAQAESHLQSIHDSAPLAIDAAKRKAKEAADKLDDFTRIGRKAEEARVTGKLEQCRQTWEAQRKKLSLLEQLHASGNATAEPEAQLASARKATADAEASFHRVELETQHSLKTRLPREAERLEAEAKSSALLLAQTEADFPRQIALIKKEIANLKELVARRKHALEMELADDKLVEPITAPSHGWFYHGSLLDSDGGDLAAGSSIASRQKFATFMAEGARLKLVAFTGETTARSLADNAPGQAFLPGRENLENPVKVEKISPIPDANGRCRIDFAVEWNDKIPPLPGWTAEVRMISYESPAAIVVPTSALEFTRDGWTVSVKLADGKTSRRVVKRGRVSGDLTEILSGLEPGQVITTP